MQINGITVPDPSTQTDYYPDPIGGWMYIVTTNVTVAQKALTDIQNDLAQAQAAVAANQAIVDALTPQITSFATAVAAVAPAPVDTPTQSVLNSQATSTPAA